MSLQELMICDWVYVKDYPMKPEAKQVTANHFVRSLCEFEPIPITAEILKANGFKQEQDGTYTWYDDVHIPEQVYVAVSFRRDRSVRTVDILNHRCSLCNHQLPCGTHVHKLQHALRLCGLNELADNFKIQ